MAAETQQADTGGPAGGQAVTPHLASKDPLVEQMAILTESLLHADTVAGALRRIISTALVVISEADVASVTLRGADGGFHTPAETDPVAARLDDIQYETGEGPCVEAAGAASRAVAQSHDLATEPRWSRFAPRAVATGNRAVLSTSMLAGGDPAAPGALNVYSRRPHRFTEADRNAALLLSCHASLVLAAHAAVSRAELEATDLRKAIDSRDVIGQAKGILTQRHGITAEEAFDRLRGISQNLNIKLVDLATTLATRHRDLDG